MEIMRNDIPDIISVKSIRTVYSIDFRGTDITPVGDIHDFPELIFIRCGQDIIRIGDKRVTLNAGQMTFYPPSTYHIGEGNNNVALYVITFDSDSEALNALYSRAITLSKRQIDELSDIVDLGLSLFERIPHGEKYRGMKKKEGASDYKLQKMKYRLELFILDVYNEVTNRPESSEDRKKLLFEEICDYLGRHIDHSVSLDSLAKQFHLGKSTLTALFRNECGMGVISYFNMIKIDEAKRLIRVGDMNFTEISDSLGFSSVHYFSRLFKSITGMTPSEYSKTNK